MSENRVPLDALGRAAKNVGRRVAGTLAERHFGIDGDEVSSAIGMAGDVVVPILTDAYSARPDEFWLETFQRRLLWSLGIATTVAAVGGASYCAWRWFGRRGGQE